jgi:hypothetical protein
MFTRQHYEAVAKTIKENECFIYPSIQTMAKMFKADNPRFDARTFFKACGFIGDNLEAAMYDFTA